MTYKDYKPEVSIDHVRQQCEKLKRDAKRNINNARPVRFFKCLKWKYNSSETFRDVVDAAWVMVALGLICAIILGISIVEYLNPHL